MGAKIKTPQKPLGPLRNPKKSLDQKLTPQNPMPNFRASKDIKNSLQQKGIPVRIKPGNKHDG